MKLTDWALYIICAALLAQAAGCASAPARKAAAGDRVSYHFACFLQNGELAATTRKSDMERDKKSVILLPPANDDPVQMTLGEAVDPGLRAKFTFEDELFVRLGESLAGMAETESRRVAVVVERIGDESAGSRKLKLSRKRLRPREMRIPLEKFNAGNGVRPEVGQPYVIDPLIPGSVAEVTEKDVLVRFRAEPGSRVETAYGPATIREEPDSYVIELDAPVGTLLRNGSLVGRISEADDRNFTVDYGNPFSGEKLACDITVLKVEEPAAAPVEKK